MATLERRNITAGPSKWDLIIEGLVQNKPLDFTLESIDTVKVRISTLARKDDYSDHWVFEGCAITAEGHFPCSGYFNCSTRQGWYVFGELS